LKADIEEPAVATQLLKRGFKVLRPIGDRLSYDMPMDYAGRLVRIQVKSAWYEPRKGLRTVDSRRTKTNRRHMLRARYSNDEFMPARIFNGSRSGISLIEADKRQRKPRSAEFIERRDTLRKKD
jgi:hypothetical protein